MRSLLLVILLMFAAGVAARDSDSISSEALQIARAAHFDRIRDTTAKDIQTASQLKPWGSPGAMTAIGAGQATGLLKPPPGLSPQGAAGMSLALGFLTALPVAYPENSSRLLVWMPKEMAATPEEARDVLRDILLEAIKQAVPDAEVKFVPQERGSKVQSHFSIVRAGAEPERLMFLGLQDWVLPKVEKTPAILGGVGERYTWGNPRKSGNGLLTGYTWSNLTLKPEERQASLANLSSKLPNWVYLYVAPSPLIAGYPQLLHEGEVMLFIEPGADRAALANAQQPEATLTP